MSQALVALAAEQIRMEIPAMLPGYPERIAEALDAAGLLATQRDGLAARIEALIEEHRGNRTAAYSGTDNYVPIYRLEEVLAADPESAHHDGAGATAEDQVQR